MSRSFARISFRAGIVLLSIIVALVLPSIIGTVVKNPASTKGIVGNSSLPVTVIRVSAAFILIVAAYSVLQAREDRELVRTAKRAGLFLRKHAAQAGGKTNERNAPEIMIIGSTGRSFVQTDGDLYAALRQCREAKIMLLDPREYGAIARTGGIPDPEITVEAIREQVMKSIESIRSLRTPERMIRLKLYPDMPLLKMAILGEQAYIRHYHTALNVRSMPEFAFRNVEHHGGLYLPFYRYFLSRWQDPDIPEYDFSTDELVYRDRLGYEVLREPFEGRRDIFDDTLPVEGGASGYRSLEGTSSAGGTGPGAN